MIDRQLTMWQLMDRYPRFKEYAETPPKIYKAQRALDGPLWWVYVQLEEGTRWRRVGTRLWKEGMELVQAKTPFDWAITSKRRGYLVPTYTKINPQTKIPYKVKVGNEVVDKQFRMKMPPGHQWCRWCRRPTLFLYFAKHHSFVNAKAYDPTRRRCLICGGAQGMR
jgi:hypothetical protein